MEHSSTISSGHQLLASLSKGVIWYRDYSIFTETYMIIIYRQLLVGASGFDQANNQY